MSSLDSYVVSDYEDVETRKSGLTSDVLHGDLELLPVPDVFVPRHLLHDSPELVEPLAGLRTQVVSSDAVPVVFGHLTRLAALFNGGEVCDWVVGLLAREGGRRRLLVGVPGGVELVEVEGLDAEGVEHSYAGHN